MAVDQHTAMRILMSERVKLFAYIWSIVRDEHVAEDVWQDLSILVLDKREQIRDAKALPTWLRRSARLKALEAVRRESRAPVLIDDHLLDRLERFWDRYDTAATSNNVDALRRCAEHLTDHNKQIVAMRYVEGFSGTDVAKKLGRSPKAVYMALTRIHKQLRKCVRARLAEDDND